MPVINRIAEFHAEMAQWRHRIHSHPETAFEEHQTGQLGGELLESFGIPVDRGDDRTGVMVTLQGWVPSSRAIALRADMDGCPSRNATTSHMSPAIAAACTPVVTMAIPRCCSAQP